ncbi:MAG TPA: glycosyltransferase family 2 protein [Lachnospiraceae bacterium]|nr:glycosyltransferase family 2 protein [Lachnospiraceae bacterium]
MQTTIVIPNYNGMYFLEDCLKTLTADISSFGASVMIVDNGSEDGSVQWIKSNYPRVRLITLPENTGFCKAVNVGIKAAQTPYVILLNNDTKVKFGFTKALTRAIAASDSIFSVSAKMLDMKNDTIIDNAGDLYTALGWAFARGKGKKADEWNKSAHVFSACGGASIYRKEVIEKLGYFDENHFAYLEDVDIGWRARIFGYTNLYEPKAQVLHAGSAVSGSRYNRFKVGLSSANSVYIIGKNMPLLQILINLPFLLLGFLIKTLFFTLKGMGLTYIHGCLQGLKRCFTSEGRKHKVKFQFSHLGNYTRLQLELWWNMVLRIVG